jgi:hypothetical protein
MKRTRFLILGTGLLLLLVWSTLRSNVSTQNPHGPLAWDCQDCHTAESWQTMRDPLAFDHDQTGFVLVGAHATARCAGCHEEPAFSHVSTTCADCHSDHHQGQLGLACQNCHTPVDWQNRRDALELHMTKGFPLTGPHAVVDCEACHRGHGRQEYAGTPVECEGCHLAAYAATDDPNHMQAGFSSRCETCHRAAAGGWVPSNYVHPPAWPLSGAHQRLACNDCHSAGYAGTPNACYDCHAPDFNAAGDPDHVTSGFSHECTLCHSTLAWVPSTFDHAATGFPLTGRHLTATCNTCHASGYAGTPTGCFDCHATEYQQTQDPDHVSAGFGQDCAVCHSTSSWTPAVFDHTVTGFVLTGLHVPLACESCHAGGYTGTPNTCVGCHQGAYDATTDPNHAAALFPTTCESCHSTGGWTPASWDHDGLYFPIYSGAHRAAWSACTECHTNPANFGTFECVTCHEHSQSQMDPKHTEVRDYQFLSSACYTCHPRGRH